MRWMPLAPTFTSIRSTRRQANFWRIVAVTGRHRLQLTPLRDRAVRLFRAARRRARQQPRYADRSKTGRSANHHLKLFPADRAVPETCRSTTGLKPQIRPERMSEVGERKGRPEWRVMGHRCRRAAG